MNEKLILSIIDRFCSGCIGELELNDETVRLLLRKEVKEASAGKAAAAGTGHQLEIPLNQEISAAVTQNMGDCEKITSPIVATFYSAPAPDAPPFVKPGAKIKAGQTLCILEAMKMMNHLNAEFDCELVEVHAASGDFVEYGQTLFTVKKL